MSVAKVSPIISEPNCENAAEKAFCNGVSLRKIILQKRKVKCHLSDRTSRVLEITILTTVVICVMALLSIPSTLHFATQEQSSDANTSSSTMAINMSDCGEYGIPNSSVCSSMVWELQNNTSLAPEAYAGSVCSSYLLSWQNCAIGTADSGIIVINATVNQAENEQLAIDTLDTIERYATDKCEKDAVPFLCLYGFPIISCLEQSVVLPTKEECQRISKGTCRVEFNFAQAVGLGDILPDCNELPSSGQDISGGSGMPSDALSVNESNITCSPDFYEENSTCFPLCKEWKIHSDGNTAFIRVSAALATVLAILGGIAVIVGSIIRYKSMLVFPSVFVVYLTIAILFIAFAILLAVIDIDLMCGSRNLIESLLHPTPFCTMSGVILQYFLVNGICWWILHVSSIFYKVMFPFTARMWKSKEKYIHIVLVIVGLLIPLPGVIATLTMDNYGYIIVNAPPLFCGPSNIDLVFYSLVLFNNIILVIGIPMLIIVVWSLHKSQIATGFRKGVWKLSTAETKIILVLCYYALFGLVSLSYFAVESARQEDQFIAIQQYFVCEAAGSGTECDRSGFDIFGYQVVTVIVYLMLGLIPAVNLIFVINWTAARDSCKRFWMKHLSKITISQRSMTINQNKTVDTVETNV